MAKQGTKSGFQLIRKLLFCFDAEAIHTFVLESLAIALNIQPLRNILAAVYGRRSTSLRQQKLGLAFPSPIGLAAGFDKDAKLAAHMSALGFGFCESGTVTLKAQPGNSKPRLWRLVDERALVNAMGFNNDGADKFRGRLLKQNRYSRRLIPVGVNIGKNKNTPLEEAAAEYQKLLEVIYDVADYIVINISSPNTPGLRDLQKPSFLQPLLKGVVDKGRQLAAENKIIEKPLLVKLAPELGGQDLQAVLAVIKEVGVRGVVATNTLMTNRGGKSGQPLRERALAMVGKLRQILGPDFVIIGVGGIFAFDDVRAYLKAGADLVQVYTGWVYSGPGMLTKLNQQMAADMQTQGTTDFGIYLERLRH